MTDAVKVLIAEDDVELATELASQLTKIHGYPSHIVSSMEALISELRDNAESYFISIVHLGLKGAKETEAVDLTLKFELPTIVLTAPIDDSLLEDLQEKNIADYAIKHDNNLSQYLIRIVHRIKRNACTKVLIVDESQAAKEHMSRLLKIQQFNVLEASTKTEAVNILDTNIDTRIVIIDCFYGKSDGFELTSYIRKKYKESELVIIGVSRYGGQDLSAKFIKQGANDFLLKPFLHEEFFCRVNHAAEFLDQVHDLIKINDQKSYLMGMAAHDIRGPIAGNIGLTSLILEHQLSDSETEIFLKTIQKTNHQLLDLLNGLLDISSIQSGKFDLKIIRCDFCGLLKERVDFYTIASQKKNISLGSELPEKAEIQIDPVRMTQVIDNLITNAIKFTPENRSISVKLANKNGHLCMNVVDDGPGIKEEERPRLFGIFERLSSPPTGGETSSGLGLAISKSIVEAHHGSIGYRPAPERGSDFFIHLPVGQAAKQ